MKLLKENTTRSRVRLESRGHTMYSDYWTCLIDQTKEVSSLRKHLSGSINEERFSGFSKFKFSSEGMTEGLHSDSLILSDIDLDFLHGRELIGLPESFIRKAIAQRASWLMMVNSEERLGNLFHADNQFYNPPYIKKQIKFNLFDSYRTFTGRQNSRNASVKDSILENFAYPDTIEYADFKDWGYLTRFTHRHQSRNGILKSGMLSKIGKYHRSIFCSAPMPDFMGSFDAVFTSLCCNMLTIIPRNAEFKSLSVQLCLANDVIRAISNTNIPWLNNDLNEYWKQVLLRNLCVAIGVQEADVERFEAHYALGVRCFRIYSIATDRRLAEQTQRIIRKVLSYRAEGEKIELFVGQITSLEQFEDLANYLSREEWALIDGFFLGNGGGIKCSTAETGMIVATPYLCYSLRNNPVCFGKSLIIEGGVGDEPAAALLLGASGLSHAAGISGGCIEAPNGGLYISDGTSLWSPQRGESSASTKLIEASLERQGGTSGETSVSYDDGTPKQVEGKGGFIRMDPRHISMCGRIRERNEWLAQCLVKLGVQSMSQLHSLGVELRMSDARQIFGVVENQWPSDAIQLPSGQKLSANNLIDEERTSLIIPLPLRKRTAAQRAVASSLDLAEPQLQPIRRIEAIV